MEGRAVPAYKSHSWKITSVQFKPVAICFSLGQTVFYKFYLFYVAVATLYRDLTYSFIFRGKRNE